MARKKKKLLKNREAKKEWVEFLLGRHKAEILRFCAKKQWFYQAEATFALGWRVRLTQYYLQNLVKHRFLTRVSTPYYTYYQINLAQFSKLTGLL